MLERATRWSVIRAVFWRSWVRLVSGAWAIYGVLDFVDSKAVPRLPDRLREIWSAIYILPSLSWRTWLMIALAIIAVVSIEGAYRFALLYKKQFDELTKNEGELSAQLESERTETSGLRVHIQKLYRNYREKHLSQMKEIGDLKREILVERSKNASARITGDIEEVYFKWYPDGLNVTMLVVLVNHSATTTIRDFVLRFPSSDKEYTGETIDVSPYSFVRTRRIDIFRREETWEPLEEADLRASNTAPLERIHHREGWLRFRMPRLDYEPKTGKFILDVIDATGKVHPVEISSPWPETGTIKFTRRFEEESKARAPKKRPRKGQK